MEEDPKIDDSQPQKTHTSEFYYQIHIQTKE